MILYPPSAPILRNPESPTRRSSCLNPAYRRNFPEPDRADPGESVGPTDLSCLRRTTRAYKTSCFLRRPRCLIQGRAVAGCSLTRARVFLVPSVFTQMPEPKHCLVLRIKSCPSQLWLPSTPVCVHLSALHFILCCHALH